jgi:hypothetical protein
MWGGTLAEGATTGAEQSYTVREGDCLSGIAHKMLGDARKWPDLAAWNDLEVVEKNGVFIVWIVPGQTLKLAPEELRLDPVAIHEYYGHTKVLMEREIFRMAGIRDPYPRWNNADFTVKVEVQTRDAQALRKQILWLETVGKHLRHLERYAMVDAIHDWTLADQRLNKFWPNDPDWVQHRKASLLIMAVLDIESNGKFVRGSHGELGPFQIKPKTFAHYYNGHIYDGTVDIERILMTDFEAGLLCAMEILQENGELRHSVAQYNKGSNKWVYAHDVLRAFNRMFAKGE